MRRARDTRPRPWPSGSHRRHRLQHHRRALRFPQLHHPATASSRFMAITQPIIWRHKGNPPNYAARRFDTMNEWLAAVEADTRNVPLRQKIIERKPARSRIDACWRSAVGWVADPGHLQHRAELLASASTVTGSGATALNSPTDSRVAGVARDTRVATRASRMTSDIMRCALRQPQRSDYAATFSDAQWARLPAAFPSGVCDYSRPGIGQVEPQPWQTFADGPGRSTTRAHHPSRNPISSKGARRPATCTRRESVCFKSSRALMRNAAKYLIILLVAIACLQIVYRRDEVSLTSTQHCAPTPWGPSLD